MARVFPILIFSVGLSLSIESFASSQPLSKCQSSFILNEIELIRNIFSDPRAYETYRSQEGYVRFSERAENSHSMQYVFDVARKALGLRFKGLNWRKFHGSALEFKALKAQILNEDGSVREEFKGMSGYILFARERFKGDMEKAFRNVSAAFFPKKIFRELGWRKFHGSALEFKALKAQILNEDGSVREEFKGMSGYILFARERFKGDMDKAFRNVSAAFPKKIFRELGWRKFQGSAREFKALKAQILNEDGFVRREFIGMEGLSKFAEKHFEGDMQTAFRNVSAALSKALFKELDWYVFKGSAREFRVLRPQILNENGFVRREFTGMEGLSKFAEEYFEGDMLKAFHNVSAALSSNKGIIKKLEWRLFHGSAREFKALKAQILNEDGSVREEFIGMEGLSKFAEKHFEGNMQKAFLNVSAAFSPKKGIFKELEWRLFYGFAPGFRALKAQILNEDGSVREEFIEMEGLSKFAEEHVEGDMQKAFHNVSAAFPKKIFRELGWRQFQGSAREFKALKAQILNEDGSVREEFIGMEGLSKFAEKHFEGNMQKAFHNVSAMLGGSHVMRNLGLDWKAFNGAVSEYNGLIRFFRKNPAKAFRGADGQRRVAREVFKGDMQRAYRNVSALRERLLGSWSAFRELNWPRR